MRRLALAIIVAIGVLAPWGLTRAIEPADVERILEAARTGSKVTDYLDVLSNRFGPRLTSSDALDHASEWTRKQFQEIGLANARLEEWGEFPVGFNRGPWQGRMLSPEPMTLEFGTPAWSAGTRGAVKGHVVMAPQNPEELDAAKARLAGAWVFTRTIRGAGGAPPEFREKLEAAYNEAGIAGLVRPSRGELIVTSGNYRISWDNLPARPSITLVQAQWEKIAGLIQEGKEVTLEFDIRNFFRPGPVKQYNVIADLPGTDKPDEYVIVGGHIDTWDSATGTCDNGTGCATTLEAARILMAAGVKPRRTIRFMLWSGEEQGLLGSAAYVRANPDLMPKISAVLVHDGGTNYLSGIKSTPAMQSDMELVFAPVKGLNADMPFSVQVMNDGLTPGSSDHDSFLRAGVPAFFWNQSGRADYNHIHHTQFDTFDGAIPEYQEHSAKVVALGAYGLASLDRLLPRDKLVAAGGRSRRRMGVQLEELKIVEVMEGGVAEKAGVKVGDVIVSIDGIKIESRQGLFEALGVGEPKKKVKVLRDGQEVEVTFEFPASPVNP
jgi:hypothetical protein